MTRPTDKPRPSDETLMAFADDELDPIEAQRVAEYLRSDPEARRLVESFQRSAELAAAAFSQPVDEPPPAHLIELLRSAPLPQSKATAGDTLVDLVTLRARRLARTVSGAPWRSWAMPAAAAAAVVVAMGLGLSLSSKLREGRPEIPELALGPVPATGTLGRLLETAASGTPMRLDGERALVAVATFRDRSGRPCREVELVVGGDGSVAAAGVACRAGPSAWVLEGAARVAAAEGPSGFRPAGAEENDALTHLIALLGAEQAIAAQEERTLIDSGWARKDGE